MVDHEIQAEVMLSLYRLFSKEFVRAFLLAVVVIVGGGGVDAIIVIFAIEFDGVLFFSPLFAPIDIHISCLFILTAFALL